MFVKASLISLLATIGLVAGRVAGRVMVRDFYAETYHGEATYYTLGLGACGQNHAGQDESANVVGLSSKMMGEGPTLPNNPFCGRRVSINANGRTIDATVVDKCPGCGFEDLDVSRKIFRELFTNLALGRESIEWTLY